MNDHRLVRNIKLSYINTFITNLNMQSAIWVLYLAYCGMNLMQIGMIEGIYHITSMICEIPSGALADLVGRKRSMILSRICVAVSCIIMLLSRSFWLFALGFVVQALGNSFNSGSEEALVYDSMKCLAREEQYIKVNGRLNMLIEISQAAATVAGGVLAEYSYFWCYAACVAISLMALLPVFFLCEPPVGKTAEKEESKGAALVARHFRISFEMLTGDMRIFKNITYYSAIFAAYTMLFFYSQQYYFELGYNKVQISLLMLAAGISSCAGAMISEKLYRGLGQRGVLGSACIVAVTFLCYGFEMPGLAAIMFILASLFNSVLYPIQSKILNGLIPSEQRATLLSVNSMFFSIVMVISFPVVGALADRWELSCVFIVFGILLLAFVLAGHQKWYRAEKNI